mgnify:CR=1 FL=1
MSFYLSKILWLILNPYNFFIFVNFIIIFSYIFRFKIISITLFIINFVFLLAISFFPIGNYLINKIEKEYHFATQVPNYLDGILVLGGATSPFLFREFNQVSVNESAERLIESVKIIREFENAKIIFSGGSGVLERPDLGHADAAKFFYETVGIDTQKIIFENISRNTYENILFTKNIINPKKNEKWLLITSAFHMKRAILVGKKHKWNFIPYAVDFKTQKKIKFKPSFNLLSNLTSFQKASHEWLGLLSYYFMNRTERIF